MDTPDVLILLGIAVYSTWIVFFSVLRVWNHMSWTVSDISLVVGASLGWLTYTAACANSRSGYPSTFAPTGSWHWAIFTVVHILFLQHICRHNEIGTRRFTMLTVFLAASSGIVATYRPAASEHTPYDSCVPLFFVASMWAWISAYLSLTLCCCEDDGDPFSGRRTLDSNRVRLTTFMCIQIVIVMVSAFGTSCGGDLKGDAEQISLVTSEIGLLLCATDCIWKLGACVDDDGDGF